MKFFVATIAATLLIGGTSTFAAEGRVPASTLAAMGLSNMTVMSDVQGEQIRGKGFAIAYGHSSVKVSLPYLPPAKAESDYFAIGKNGAAGGSDASAGLAASLKVNLYVGAKSNGIRRNGGKYGNSSPSASLNIGLKVSGYAYGSSWSASW